jgi:hypothetical protein
MSGEATAINRDISRSLAGASAGAALLVDRPLFADQAGIVPTTVRRASNTTNTLFGSLKQIDAGLLDVGYAEVARCTKIKGF